MINIVHIRVDLPYKTLKREKMEVRCSRRKCDKIYSISILLTATVWSARNFSTIMPLCVIDQTFYIPQCTLIPPRCNSQSTARKPA